MYVTRYKFLFKRFLKNKKFRMLLYRISLKGCYGGAENYCATVFVKIFKILAVLVLIDSLLIAITLVTIQKRITHYFHLIYIFIVYLLFYLYDHGTTLVRHGFHNMTIFILFSLIEIWKSLQRIKLF